jgi:GDPmannose 4,6-dehydratase
MWMMLQGNSPEDYVVGTGESHSVRDFAEAAFAYVGLDYRKYVASDDTYYRPAEIHELKADASKAKTVLGWASHHRFIDLVQEMVESDLEALSRNREGVVPRR